MFAVKYLYRVYSMTRYKRRSDNPMMPEDGTRKVIHAYWIHERKTSSSSVTGYFILPSCICSNCGNFVPSERERCPKCRAIMDAEPKKQ